MKYLSTPNFITLTSGTESSITLNVSNPYFNTIKSLLDSNETWSDKVASLMEGTWSKRLEESGTDFSTNNGGVVYYKGRMLSPSFGQVVTKYLDESIPVSPLTNLIENLQGVSDGDALEVMELVSEGVLPLTYTGEVIGYKRQSWINKGFEDLSSYEEYKREVFNRTHKPGDYVEYNQGLTVGTLDWAGRFCPDQGCLQEVVVNPADILNVKSLTWDKPFLVKRYMFLGNIREQEKGEDRGGLVFIMQTNPLDVDAGSSVIVRKPYSPETIREYFNTLITRTPSVEVKPLPIGKGIEVQFEGVSACS